MSPHQTPLTGGDTILGDRQIEELALRVFQGHATPDEESRVEAWRKASPENARAYRVLEAVWEHTGDGLGQVSAPPPEPEDIILREGAERAESPSAGPVVGSAARPTSNGKARTLRWTRGIWAAAAAILLLLTGSLARSPTPSPTEVQLTVREVTTGPNEMVTVRLEDGTVVRLAPRSRLEFREGRDRQIWLEGKAFLGVATDPDRPFLVRTAGGDAVALGTRFEVGARDRDLRVLVVEGKVELRTGESRVELGPRKLGESLAGSRPTVREVEDVLPHLAWLGHTLVFHDTPLEDAAREVEDRFGIPIRFRSQELARRRVTASFTDQRLDDVLRVICRAVGAQCNRSGDTVFVASPDTPALQVPSRDGPDIDRLSVTSPQEK